MGVELRKLDCDCKNVNKKKHYTVKRISYACIPAFCAAIYSEIWLGKLSAWKRFSHLFGNPVLTLGLPTRFQALSHALALPV